MSLITRLFVLFTLLAASATLSAQQVYEGQFELDKKIAPTAPGVAIELKGNPEAVLARVEETFRAQKAKPKKLGKGLIMFEGVTLSEVSGRTLDYYFRSETPKNGPSRVIMYMSLGNDNFISPMSGSNTRTAESEVEGGKRFLKRMVAQSMKVEELEAAVAAQAAILAEKEAAEKKVEEEEKALMKEQEDIESAIGKAEKDIKDGRKEIEDAQKAIEAAKKEIAEAESRIAAAEKQLNENKQQLTAKQKEVGSATKKKEAALKVVSTEKAKLKEAEEQLNMAKE